MFTPALSILKKEYPNSQIDAFVMFEAVKEFYKKLPEINKVYHFDFLNSSTISALIYVFKLWNKYDVSLNVYPSNRKEYNIINFMIGAKKRAAVKYLHKDFLNLGFLNNVRIIENDNLHNVVENIKLVEKITNRNFDDIPSLNFPLSEEDEIYASEYLTKLKIKDDDLVVGIHAGCSTLKNHINRRWEPEKYADLIVKLINEKNAKVLIFGGPDEEKLKENIISRVNSDSVYNINSSTLVQTAAIIKRSNLFISNDSGLMHIAAAMGRKTVAIIGPTNINYIHPWQTENKIVSLELDCAPCFYYSPKPLTCSRTDIQYKCIKDLSVEKVFDTVESLI